MGHIFIVNIFPIEDLYSGRSGIKLTHFKEGSHFYLILASIIDGHTLGVFSSPELPLEPYVVFNDFYYCINAFSDLGGSDIPSHKVEIALWKGLHILNRPNKNHSVSFFVPF